MHLIVGCGLSGAVIARRLADKGQKVTIIDKRDHIGGNCYDYKHPETGILMNKYGAHLFHTNDEGVWDFVRQWGEWVPWEHEVVGHVDGQLVPIPVNINTVNTLFGLSISTEGEMREWLDQNQVKTENPQNGKEAALTRVGPVLYEKIFREYTKKQWDKYPEELDASVLQRIPVRDNHDGRYFTDKYQALPKEGYTKWFEKLLDHPLIEVRLNTDYFGTTWDCDSVIYTGPIDHYFAQAGLPKLEYRSINFVEEVHDMEGHYQPNSVVNWPSGQVDFTRIVEYKHFLDQKSDKTVIVKEYTTDNGDPYYPVPNEENRALYNKYKALADGEKGVKFIGRLASYKYFNMDQAIRAALDFDLS